MPKFKESVFMPENEVFDNSAEMDGLDEVFTDETETDETGEVEEQTQDKAAEEAPQTEPQQEIDAAGRKFKSVDDLARSYAELERYAMQLANQHYQQQQQQVDPKKQDYERIARFVEKAQENPVQAIADIVREVGQEMLQPFRQQLQQQQVESIMTSFKASHSDFDQVLPYMQQVYQEMPSLQYLPLQDALNVVYNMGKARMTPEQIKAAQEAGQKAALESIQAKKGAFVESAGKAKKINETPNFDQELTRILCGR
jgi:hypothetical protein